MRLRRSGRSQATNRSAGVGRIGGMGEPLMTRNFALLLVALTSVLLAIPFADRNDWQGWVACFVILAAVGWIVGIRLWFVGQTVIEWWNGRDLD
jgi:hypothetical protein